MSGVSLSLVCFSPAGVLARPAAVRLAVRRLRALGFDAGLDEAAEDPAIRVREEEVPLNASHSDGRPVEVVAIWCKDQGMATAEPHGAYRAVGVDPGAHVEIEAYGLGARGTEEGEVGRTGNGGAEGEAGC